MPYTCHAVVKVVNINNATTEAQRYRDTEGVFIRITAERRSTRRARRKKKKRGLCKKDIVSTQNEYKHLLKK